MTRLPTPGGDNGNWGSILNDFLSTAHNTDGTLKDNSVTKAKLSSSVQTSLDLADTAIPASQKGTASGVATLDTASKLTTSQLPDGVVREGVSVTTNNLLRKRSDGLYEGVDDPASLAAGAAADTLGRLSRAATGIVPLGPIGGVPSASSTNSSSTGLSYRMPLHMTTDSTDLRVGFINAVHTATGETIPATELTVKAALEIGGVTYPLYFNGSLTRSLGPGAFGLTDPLGLDVAAGTAYYVRFWINTSNTGDTYPTGLVLNGSITALGSSSGSWQTGDAVSSTGVMSSTSNTLRVGGFVGVFGRVLGERKPVILGVGDSILGGAYDSRTSPTINDVGGWGVGGFLIRALNETYPYIGTPVGSDQVQNVANATKRVRYSPLWAYGTHVLEALGYNDLSSGGRTTAQLQADKITLARSLADRGLSVCWHTITPKTSSTDNWATTGNQWIADTTFSSRRIAFNDWVRDGAPINSSFTALAIGATTGAIRIGEAGHPVSAYVETADTVETARNSGIWKVTGVANGYCQDGVHPVAAGYQLLQVPVETWLSALTA